MKRIAIAVAALTAACAINPPYLNGPELPALVRGATPVESLKSRLARKAGRTWGAGIECSYAIYRHRSVPEYLEERREWLECGRADR